MNLVPAHVANQRLEKLQDPKETLQKTGIPMGGYIRVSTPKDSQESSIENQKKLLADWASVNKQNLVRYYLDVATGAYISVRSELQEMLEDLKAGKIKGVVTKELSRTSRDVMDMLTLKRQIAEYGGFLIAIKEGYDSRKDDDEFLLVLHAALAQKERKTTAGRVKVTQMLKAREGKTNVSLPAFGYQLGEDRQHLVVNPEQARIYRFIVERFLDGWGQLKIAKWLNQHGIPTRRGRRWTTNAVATILRNPVYLGISIYNVTTFVRTATGERKRVIRPQEEWIVRENTHEPLISEEEFARIQAIMAARRERFGRHWTCDRKYLGSGILRCARCGEKIYGGRFPAKSSPKSDGPRRYYYRYVCQNRYGNCGSTTYWDMDRVDRLLLDAVVELFEDEDKIRELVQSELQSQLDKDTENREAESLRQQISRIDAAMKRQQMAWEAEAITLEEYRKRMSELREEKRALAERLMALESNARRSENVLLRLSKLRERVLSKINHISDWPFEEKVTVLTAVFDSVYLTEDYRIARIVLRAD